MRNLSVDMGAYYYGQNDMVRTVCRATDANTGASMIAYVSVRPGGTASDVMVLPESDFFNKFVL